MDIDWNMPALQAIAAPFTNRHAHRVNEIARRNIGGEFKTFVEQTFHEEPAARIVAPYEAIVREYGTAQDEPEPWGLPALMEAAGG